MQIRFDGPPSHVSGRFIEVEDDRGRSIKVGEWRQDGSDWLLVIPDVRQTAEQMLEDIDDFLLDDDGDSEIFVAYDLPKLADRLRFALNPSEPLGLHMCRKGEPCGECGKPLDCVCHPAHLKGVIFDEGRTKMPGSIGEKLDQIIAEASTFSEYHVGTDDAFRLIVKLAHDVENQLEDVLCPSQDPNGECNAVNEAIGRVGDLERRLESELSARLRAQDDLAQSIRVQDAIRLERGYAESTANQYKEQLSAAERGRRWNKERLDHVMAQLSALHGEFRTAAARLGFVANWLENTYAKGDNQDARSARGYAIAAKEVLDKGLDWLVERDRNRGRGVMDNIPAEQMREGVTLAAARARPEVEQICRLCASLQPCIYATWSAGYIWLEVEQRLERLAGSDDVVWNVNQQRAILNLMWHFRTVEERGAPI
ncbi:hypothetical protein LCGC14_1240940 [marine sediment metagenome]|uniref:Uncharacterized protein n=1 Tax=marine sediment metagenome TaxID=412755 RepID=A0A0F9L5U4_9ZZZZ